jgi:hypothetical protein
MIESGGTFLDKASESLAGATAELEARRYSNSANRTQSFRRPSMPSSLLASGRLGMMTGITAGSRVSLTAC